MLPYLSVLLYHLLDLPPPPFIQQSPQITFCHAEGCKDPTYHSSPVGCCSGSIAYVNATGHLITKSAVHLSLQERTDIIGLAFWNRMLYLLTSSGELYDQTGKLYRTNIRYITSGNHDDRLQLRTSDNKWDSYYTMEKLAIDSTVDSILLPTEVEAVSCSSGSYNCYVLNNQAYVRWSEHRGILAPYRKWPIEVGLAPNINYEIYECQVDLEGPVRDCVMDPSSETILYIGERTIYELNLYLRQRRTIGNVSVEIAVEAIGYEETFEFSEVISTVKLFASYRYRKTAYHFAVLFETGRVYLSQYRKIVDIGSEKVVAMSTLDNDRLLLLLDTNRTRYYLVGPDELQLIE